MVEISGQPLPLAPLNAQGFKALMEAGALPFDGRVEMIEGMLVEMSPSLNAHGMALANLCIALAPAQQRDLSIVIDPALFLADDLTLAPDLVLLPGGIRSEKAKGADVALAIEVSASSLAYDLKTKPQLYAASGIREYWVVDLNNERLHIHRGPSVSGYTDITAQDWTEAATPLAMPDMPLTLSAIIRF